MNSFEPSLPFLSGRGYALAISKFTQTGNVPEAIFEFKFDCFGLKGWVGDNRGKESFKLGNFLQPFSLCFSRDFQTRSSTVEHLRDGHARLSKLHGCSGYAHNLDWLHGLKGKGLRQGDAMPVVKGLGGWISLDVSVPYERRMLISRRVNPSKGTEG